MHTTQIAEELREVADKLTGDSFDAARQSLLLGASLIERLSPQDDGRPMPTDLFLVKLLGAVDDHYDRQDAITHWIEGAWDEAMSVITEYEREI